jgi:hypothetical protein
MPLRLPRGASSPATIAERMLEAYQAGTAGTLDL